MNLSYIHRDLTACKSLSVNKNGCSQYNLFDKLHFLQRLRNEKDITIFRERILHISSGRTCIIWRCQRESCFSDPCKVRGHIGLNLKISGSTFFLRTSHFVYPSKTTMSIGFPMNRASAEAKRELRQDSGHLLGEPALQR